MLPAPRESIITSVPLCLKPVFGTPETISPSTTKQMRLQGMLSYQFGNYSEPSGCAAVRKHNYQLEEHHTYSYKVLLFSLEEYDSQGLLVDQLQVGCLHQIQLIPLIYDSVTNCTSWALTCEFFEL